MFNCKLEQFWSKKAEEIGGAIDGNRIGAGEVSRIGAGVQAGAARAVESKKKEGGEENLQVCQSLEQVLMVCFTNNGAV